jgi:4-alpha-glucanotransferase
MLFKRESGILLHPSSLPGSYGSGELGPEALRFIDFLTRMRQSLWQVLPLTPPGTAFSPYQGGSSFAGNVLLLSLDLLELRGLLDPLDTSVIDAARQEEGPLDAARLTRKKLPLLRHAAAQFLAQLEGREENEFRAFQQRQGYWLRDYARYQALQRRFDGTPWFEWPMPLRQRDAAALAEVDHDLAVNIELEEALQFLFEQQWLAVRRHANRAGVRVLGDLPIFVSHDSADVWAAQKLFQLDSAGQPLAVAGVPPDYFSASGQRWGNPLYAWDEHRREGFQWWTRRVQRTLEMTDLLRIDHFRGFAACWEIPAEEPTAIRGRWVEAPGYELLQQLVNALGPELPIVAEDLGIITDDVVALREYFGLPTMRVLQFSFTGEEKLLPHHYPRNCVAYTGTHDNDTIVGWYAGVPDQTLASPAEVAAERDRVRRYYSTDGTDIQWTCMKALLESQCAAAVFPLQDVMGLGSEARMNTPGTVGPHNWSWRFRWDQLEERMVEGLAYITRAAGRNEQLR